jgi:periplasmic divalent cation tolerance protein
METAHAHCMVLTTCGNPEEARKLAAEVVGARLAACVQMLPVLSFFEWKGEVRNENETLLLMKTRTALYADLERFVADRHAYEVPEIIRLPVGAGLESYLRWIDETTADAGASD